MNIRSLVYAWLGAFAVTMVGCAGSAADQAALASDEPTPAMAAATDESTAQSTDDLRILDELGEAGIAGVLAAVNTGEVLQAKTVLGRVSIPEVRAHAEEMKDVHSRQLGDDAAFFAKRGVVPITGPTALLLTTEATDIAASLKAVPNDDVDRAYVDSQVVIHGRVLFVLDYRIIPAAKDTVVRERLLTVRATVAAHLEHAKELKKSL